MEKFVQILNAIERTYVNGSPLHLSQPGESAFAIYTAEEFGQLSDFEVQGALRHRHILVTERPGDPIKFDRSALSELRVLTGVDTIQGVQILEPIHKD